LHKRPLTVIKVSCHGLPRNVLSFSAYFFAIIE
jgi:hypothetical protein